MQGLTSPAIEANGDSQETVGPQPTTAEAIAGRALTRRGFEKVRTYWQRVDSYEVARLSLEERRRLAEKSRLDAMYLQALRISPHSTLMQQRNSSDLSRQLLAWEVDLRLNEAFIAPELLNEQIVDSLVEAGVGLARLLGPGKERDFQQIDKLSKLHDIVALEALWRCRSAITSQEKAVAKVMLGSTISDAMREIVALSKRLERTPMDPGELESYSGPLAEFMLITWERLHLYLDPNPDIIGNVFIRSAMQREDTQNVNSQRSTDALIVNLDQRYAEPQQYKTGRGGHDYDPIVQVVRIPNWRQAREHIREVAKYFDILMNPRASTSVKETALAGLDGYFGEPRILQMSR